MSPKKGPTIREQAIQILLERGPLKVPDMMPWIKGAQAHSVHSKCLEMEKMGLMSHDDAMVWTLKPGVTPMTLVTGELQDGTKKEGEGMTTDTGKDKTPLGAATGAPLSQESQFSELLLGVGVEKIYIPTITKLFFDGDINSLNWLREVLNRHAAGFVKPHQIKLIFASWSKSRGLPYNPEDFPLEEQEAGKGKKAVEKEPAKPLTQTLAEKAGIGYRIDVDQNGNWKAVPGGPMPYQDAIEAAERRATIDAMRYGQSVAAVEEPAEGGDGKPAARSTRQAQSLQDKLMDKVLDFFIESKKGHGDEQNPQITALSQQLQTATNTINQMREDREQERFDRIEGNIAALASRDPWDDPRNIEVMRQRLGIPNQIVTDQSPAVQILKDSADKIDKNVGRLVGIVERAALQSDQFRPEETRTSAEKETKAGDLLDEASKRQRSTELRKRAFNL